MSVLMEKQQRTAFLGKKNKKRDRRGHTVFASPYDPYWLVYCILFSGVLTIIVYLSVCAHINCSVDKEIFMRFFHL